jgi:hypothetical protein
LINQCFACFFGEISLNCGYLTTELTTMRRLSLLLLVSQMTQERAE